MPVTIRIFTDSEATVEGGFWQCANPDIEEMLNLHARRGVGRYTPHLDWALASAAVERWGGEIISRPPPEEYDPAAVY